MKIEIEVTEDEVKSAIERKIKTAIAEHANGYWVEQGIKDTIKKHWQDTVEKLVKEEVENSPKMRDMIQKSLENKIRAQLNVMLKEKKPDN